MIGLAYIALHNGAAYSADVAGVARISRTFTMGAILQLNDYILHLPPRE